MTEHEKMGVGMGPSGASPTNDVALAELSRGRIEEVMDRLGYAYTIDQDGDVAAEWDAGFFYFMLRGEMAEILVLHGVWRGELVETDYLLTQELCNAWNDDRLWPKAYVNRDNAGTVRLRTEHAVDYEHGVTDAQLALHITGGVGGALHLFEQAAEAFPEVWERFRPEG